jgi:hypothetical protein
MRGESGGRRFGLFSARNGQYDLAQSFNFRGDAEYRESKINDIIEL